MVDCSKDMRILMEEYASLKDRSSAELEGHFWDLVVFSVSDALQRTGFETQLEMLKIQRSIPLTKYVVIEDLPHCKMGSGGATMYILHELRARLGESLFRKRILLVHTGGQSRRLPQYSVMGKLFAHLPKCTMLDLKLTMYLPFFRKMTAGVFLTASDDIETYCVDGDFKVSNSGFTALAHPSSLEIARGHGVYVLPEQSYPSAGNTKCLKVLQKPSLELMAKHHAIIDDRIAFTDSAYVFAVDAMKCLINFYELYSPLKEELCAYGDFLTCLGTEAPPPRNLLQKVLCDLPISVVVLPKSTFYHIGTLTEYLDHICSDDLFKRELSIVQGSQVNMHSRLPPAVECRGRAVVELCDFSSVRDLVLGNNCVLSGCQVEAERLEVPSDVVMFTVAVGDGFVTLCFGIRDDLKIGTLWCGRQDVCEVLWDAKLFPMCPTRSESFLKTLEALRSGTGRVHEALFSLQDVVHGKNIKDMLQFQCDLIKC